MCVFTMTLVGEPDFYDESKHWATTGARLEIIMCLKRSPRRANKGQQAALLALLPSGQVTRRE